MSVMSWIQLSDWHQGRPLQEREDVRVGLLRDIESREKIDTRLAHIDMLLMSGDIAFSGKASEYVLARDELVAPILDTTELTREQVVVVPGNHDVDRETVALYSTTWLDNIVDEASASAVLSDPRRRRALLDPFAAFDDFARTVSTFDIHESPAFGYSRIYKRDSVTVETLALNTALLSARFRTDTGEILDQGKLLIGQPQLSPLLSRSSEVDLRIALLHHPPSWLFDFEHALVRRQLVSTCDLIVHGHEHVPNVQVSSEAAGSAVVVPAGAVFHGERGPWSYGYNLVVTDLQSGDGRVYLRRWSPVNRSWGPDTETAKNGLFAFQLGVKAGTVRPAPTRRYGSAERSARALEVYRRRLKADFRYADHRGIAGVTGAPFAATLPADDFYVVPRLVPADRPVERDHERRLLEILDDPDLAAEDRRRYETEYASITGQQWASRRPSETAISVGDALAAARHLVLLGSPGVGKSALTRYLARTCLSESAEMEARLGWQEDLVPIVIPLASYSDARSANQALRLEQFVLDRLAERYGRDLVSAISDLMDRDRCLMLFDGIDEVPDSRDRGELVRAVDEFLASHPTLRTIVTSRPYGYIRLAGAVPHFRLPNFSPEQVTEFVQKYYRATENAKHNLDVDIDKADAEAAALLYEIRQNQRVTELATNPLMLVIIALIRYERAHLIEERVQLYHRAVTTLVDTWAQWRSSPSLETRHESIPIDRVVRVWSEVAYWMRLEKPVGVVHRSEIEQMLTKVIAAREFSDDEELSDLAHRYFEIVAGSGLLEERASGLFAFWHPTFEEFLAAIFLATPSSDTIACIVDLRSDPRWREVILLCTGYVGLIQLDGDRATALVDAIASVDLPPDEVFFRDCLTLAGAAVQEYPSLGRSVAERVLTELLEAASAMGHPWLLESLSTASRALSRRSPSSALIRVLETAATSPRWSVRMECARLAGGGATHGDSACIKLCGELMQDPDDDVRCYAAFGLMLGGVRSVEVWNVALSRYDHRFAKMEAPLTRFIARVDPVELGEMFGMTGLNVVALAGLCRKVGNFTEEARISGQDAAMAASTGNPASRVEAMLALRPPMSAVEPALLEELDELPRDERQRVVAEMLAQPDLRQAATQAALRLIWETDIEPWTRVRMIAMLPDMAYSSGEARKAFDGVLAHMSSLNGDSSATSLATAMVREFAHASESLRTQMYALAAEDARPGSAMIAALLASDDESRERYALAAARELEDDFGGFIEAVSLLSGEASEAAGVLEHLRMIASSADIASHIRIGAVNLLLERDNDSRGFVIDCLVELASEGDGNALDELVRLKADGQVLMRLIGSESALERWRRGDYYWISDAVIRYMVKAGLLEVALNAALYASGLNDPHLAFASRTDEIEILVQGVSIDDDLRTRLIGWAGDDRARALLTALVFYGAVDSEDAKSEGVAFAAAGLDPVWLDAEHCYEVVRDPNTSGKEQEDAWSMVAERLSDRASDDGVAISAVMRLRAWFRAVKPTE